MKKCVFYLCSLVVVLCLLESHSKKKWGRGKKNIVRELKGREDEKLTCSGVKTTRGSFRTLKEFLEGGLEGGKTRQAVTEKFYYSVDRIEKGRRGLRERENVREERTEKSFVTRIGGEEEQGRNPEREGYKAVQDLKERGKGEAKKREEEGEERAVGTRETDVFKLRVLQFETEVVGERDKKSILEQFWNSDDLLEDLDLNLRLTRVKGMEDLQGVEELGQDPDTESDSVDILTKEKNEIGDKLVNRELQKKQQNWQEILTANPLLGGPPTAYFSFSEVAPYFLGDLFFRPRAAGESYFVGKREDVNSSLSFNVVLDKFFGLGKCSSNVFLTWVLPPWAYTLRNQKSLESLFFFNPRACLAVLSPTLPLEFFHDFVNSGFHVTVVRPSLELIFPQTSMEDCLPKLDTWQKRHYFLPELENILGLSTLYKFGGILLSHDVIILARLDSLPKSFVGKESENSEKEWTHFPSLLMGLKKNSSVLGDCLVAFAGALDQSQTSDAVTPVTPSFDCFRGKLGPQNGVEVLPRQKLCPFSSHSIVRYFWNQVDLEKSEMENWKTALTLSTTLVFWNEYTSSLIPEKDSLMDKAFNSFCIFCDRPFHEKPPEFRVEMDLEEINSMMD